LRSARGSVLSDQRTNQLFVTDIPSKLEEIQSLVARIDIPVRQVLIEARIVEAADTFGKSLGAKLGFVDLRGLRNGVPGWGGSNRVAVGGNYVGVGQVTLQTPDSGDAYTNQQMINLPAIGQGGYNPASFALSIFGASFGPVYGASKGGVVQLTKSLAVTWAPDNIQVNAVLPGWIDTELTRAGRAQIKGLNERVLERTPVGRWGVPDDLAGIAVFLCSAASHFVTGTAIPVDGGYSISG